MKTINKLLLIFLTMSSTSFAQEHNILRIGHRGAMGHITENTVESIQKAIDLNCDVIEIDVFKIKSGELMVFHDDQLDRLTNVTGNIEDYTYNELQKVKVNGVYQIPTLEKIIETIDRKAVLNIELKGNNTAKETHQLIQLFINKGWTNTDFIISSFKWNELEKMRSLNNSIDIAVLTEEEPADAIAFAKQINAVAINPYHKDLNALNASKIREANLKIYPWTVNDQEDINRMKELKVDGIITNYPERI
ncbi:glycerophosphodiester phosphodiesterase [Myroides phaeus]|uniref:glycerophosphodiester phosphodiesterase n=1 Tax=Myroides phaeus TaxID=702745 RepID=UPI00130327CF|nr:glycerophosphodiester phosphodiesterase family protein [Myroides phaeus]